MIVTRRKVHNSLFWVLAVLAIWNLNGVVQMLTGTQQLLSPFLLVSSVLCIATCRGGVNQYLEGPGKWFFAFFIAYIGLGTFSSMIYDSGTLRNGFVSNGPTPFVVLAGASCAWSYAREGRHKELFSGLFALALISTLSIYFSKFMANYFIVDYKVIYRASGFFREPNEAGNMACFCLMLAFVMLRQSKKRKLLFVMIGLIYLAGFLTFSKTAAISLIFLTLGQLFILKGVKIEIKFNIILLGLVLAAACFWIVSYGLDMIDLSTGQRERIMEINALMTEGEISEETTTGRTLIWAHAVNLYLESPVVGWGLGSFLRMKGLGMGSHNTFLLIFGESGFGPGLLFLIFLAVLGATGLRCKDPLIRLFVLEFMLVFVSTSLSLHTVLTRRFTTIFLGVCFGLLAGHHQFRKQQLREKLIEEAAELERSQVAAS